MLQAIMRFFTGEDAANDHENGGNATTPRYRVGKRFRHNFLLTDLYITRAVSGGFLRQHGRQLEVPVWYTLSYLDKNDVIRTLDVTEEELEKIYTVF